MCPIRMSRIESAIRVVLKFIEAFNRQDVPGMMQLLSEDCVVESPDPAPDGAVYSGRDALTQFWRAFFSESPSARLEIEEAFSYGYRCIVRWKYEWVDKTEVKRHIRGVDIFQVRDDLICEKLSYIKGTYPFG